MELNDRQNDMTGIHGQVLYSGHSYHNIKLMKRQLCKTLHELLSSGGFSALRS